MIALVVIVFIGVASIVILLMAAGNPAAKISRDRIRTLQSVLMQARRPGEEDISVADLRKTETLSAIPWLNRMLLQSDLAPRIRLLLYQANVSWTTSVLLLLTAVCFLVPVYVVDLIMGNFLIALAVGALLAFMPWVYVLQKRSKRFRKFESELPEALDLMVSALRVGHSLNSSLSLVANECAEPLSSEFRICFEEQNYGLEFGTTLGNLINRMPLPDLKMVSTAMLIQRETGGNLSEVLENTSQVIRDRFALQRQVRTHTAQGRLTGWILTLMPVVIGFLMYMISPSTISILWHTAIGKKLIYGSVVMILIGAVIIRNIVNVEV